MYFEFDDARRIHQPYTDSFQRSKYTHSKTLLTRFTYALLLYLNSGLLEDTCLQQWISKLEERNVRYVNWYFLGGASPPLPL